MPFLTSPCSTTTSWTKRSPTFLAVFSTRIARFAGVEHAGVADLAAGFGVKRRLVEDQKTSFAGFQRIDLDAVAQQGDDDALGVIGFIAEEFGRADLVLDREPDGFGRGFAGAGPGLAGFGALALHGGVENVLVHADFPGAQRLLGQVEREAVGVVELESDIAREILALAQVAGFPRRGWRGRARAWCGSGFPRASASPRSAPGRG